MDKQELLDTMLIEDEIASMAQFMFSEERQKELKQACIKLREYLAAHPPFDPYRRNRNGITPWQFMQRQIPLELRMAYDACGRLKKCK